jgi:hypothetical protein
MEYPIIIDGKTAGKLRTETAGLMTVFEAWCEDPGELLRLSVYGESEGYLGVMEPAAGRLYLKRSFSRAARRACPQQIMHAGPSGRAQQANKGADGGADSGGRQASDSVSEPVGESSGARPLSSEPGTDILWFRAGDGSLSTVWEGRSYVALPLAAHGLPMGKCLEIRIIEGKHFEIFETKKVKIV